MSRVLLRILVLLFALAAVPASAQTRAWLDRAQVSYGETATLNIETTQSVQQVDYTPLRQQFDIAGKIEGVAVPVKDGNIDEVAQRRMCIDEAQRMEAHLLRRSGINSRAHRRRHHLRAEADAQRGAISVQSQGEAPELAGNPWVTILFVHAHRSAHHDQEIRRTQIE